MYLDCVVGVRGDSDVLDRFMNYDGQRVEEPRGLDSGTLRLSSPVDSCLGCDVARGVSRSAIKAVQSQFCEDLSVVISISSTALALARASKDFLGIIYIEGERRSWERKLPHL